jgi:hypothetical protein
MVAQLQRYICTLKPSVLSLADSTRVMGQFVLCNLIAPTAFFHSVLSLRTCRILKTFQMYVCDSLRLVLNYLSYVYTQVLSTLAN